MIDEAVPVWLGAFGKHPGWDDHIADQGLETEFLVRVRRLLYVEGIGGNLDSGAWEELSDEERTPGFDHVFLWRTVEGLMAGRLWSSSDGKGRTRYPLVVCCQSRGLSGEWVVGTCLDRLEKLGDECRRVTTAAAVIGAVDSARADLRRSARSAPAARKEALAPPAAIARLHDQHAAALGPEGLLRVTYQMEREFSAFLRMEEEGTGTRSRTVDVRPRHMRVPACERDVGRACALWMQFLYGRADPAAPVLVFGRVGGGFVDVVIGEPGRGQVFCLQASPKRVPLTTEIPYNVDDAFRAEQAARVERGRTGALRDMDLGAVAEEMPRVRRSKPKSGKKGSRVGIVIVIIALLAAAGWAVKTVLSSGGGSTSTPEKEEEVPAPIVQQPANPGTPAASGEVVEKFRAWCLAYDGWLSRLVSSVKSGTDGLEGDGFLAENVRAPVLAAIASKAELNPRYVVSSPPATARELAENVPPEVGSASIVGATRKASALIESVTGAMERWPVRREAEAMAGTFRSLGWTGPAGELSALVSGVTPGDGVDIAAGVPRLVSAMQRPGMAQLVTAAREVQEHLAAIEKAEDKVLTRAAADVRRELTALAEAPSVEAVLARWSEVQGLAATTGGVQAFLEDGWSRVDHALFESQSAVHQAGATGTGQALLQNWLSEAQREVYVAIDAGSDPRRGWTIEAERARLAGELKDVESRGGEETAAAVSALRERLDAAGRQASELAALKWNAMTRDRIGEGVEQLSREVRLVESQVRDLRADVSRDVNEQLNEIRARANVSEDGIAGVDQLWVKGRDALLARYAQDEDIRALTSASRQLQRSVRRIEQASRVEGWENSVRAGWSRGALGSMVQSARASAIAAHAGSLDVASAGEEQIEAVCQSVSAQVRASVTTLREGLDRLGTVQDHVEMGYGWQESWAAGGDIRQGVEAARRVLPAIEQVAPELHAALSRLEQVDAGGRDELVRMAGDPGIGLARVQAWRGLAGVDPAWPADEAELLIDLRNFAEIRGLVQSIGDAGRRDALTRDLEASLARRWTVAMERADDWEALSACARLADDCGGQVDALSPSRQWAMSVLETRAAVAAGGDDAGNQQRAGRLAEQARALGVAQIDAWVPVVQALESLGSEDLDAVPPLEPGSVGPGRVGWQVAEESNEQRLVYRHSSGAVLGFQLVETPTGATYVGEQELSIGVVLAMIAGEARVGQEFAALTSRQEAAGMQVWGFRGAKDNLRLVTSSAWTGRGVQPATYYPAGFDPGKPAGDSPMQRVSLGDAVYLAGQLGCRLPTVAEWQAALSSVGAMDPQAGWNLRDRSVERQFAHLRSVPGWGQDANLPSPDATAFGFETLGGQAGAYEFDDGVLWAAPVQGGPNATFRHIIGNVQEYVIVGWSDESRAVLAGGGDPRERALAEWTDAARGIEAAVIGGSLFSPSERAVDQPVPARDTAGGWSDVGVRPAFSPGEGRVRRSIGARLTEVLAATPLVGPGGSR